MNMSIPAQMSVIHSAQRPLFSKLLWPIYPPTAGKSTVRASADRILDMEPSAQVMGTLQKKPARVRKHKLLGDGCNQTGVYDEDYEELHYHKIYWVAANDLRNGTCGEGAKAAADSAEPLSQENRPFLTRRARRFHGLFVGRWQSRPLKANPNNESNPCY
jgi:hypothetical protein